MKYKLKASALLVFLPLSLQLCAQTGGIILPNIFNHLQVSHDQAHQIIPNGGMRIIAPGSYHIIENITGQIIVDADDVFIEMNGFTLHGMPGSGDAIITVTADHKNILIQNGHIVGNDQTRNGIEAQEGVLVLVLKDLHISNCLNGIEFIGVEDNEVKCSKILNCFVAGCKKGFMLTQTMMSVFEYCDTCACSYASFDLIDCKYNKFKKCKAVKTGNTEADQSAYGFSAVGGLDNLFYECMAEGINKSAGSDWGAYAIGFNFGFDANKVPETESKIIDCLVDSAYTTNFGIAYGIHLDAILKDEITPEIATGHVLLEIQTYVDWSPGCDLIALPSSEVYSGQDRLTSLKVMKFDGNSLALIKEINETTFGSFSSVVFSPDGQFLARSRTSDSVTTESLAVYRTSDFTLLDEVTETGNVNNRFYDVTWFHNSHKLVLSANALGLRVYYFDGNNLSLLLENTSNLAVSSSVSLDDKYIAYATDTSFVVVDANSLEEIVSNVSQNFSQVSFNPVVCCGKYYIAAGSRRGVGDFVEIYEFDPAAQTLTKMGDITGNEIVFYYKWHPSGKYLAVSYSIENKIEIYEFNPQGSPVLNLKTNLIYGPTATGGVRFVDWSPCGTHLALVGVANTTTQVDFEIIELGDAVRNCLVDGNKVANSTGGIGAVGIFGCSCCNGIMKNVAYENCLNFSEGVLDVWYQGAAAIDQLHFNVSIPPY